MEKIADLMSDFDKKEKVLQKVKSILSIIDFLKKYLPVDSSKKYSEEEQKDVFVFMRLYQKLGGEFMRTKKGIEIHDFYEALLRTIVNEKVTVKIYYLTDNSIFSLQSRETIIGGKNMERRKFERTQKPKEPYPGAWSNVNHKQKQMSEKKISKQNKRRK